MRDYTEREIASREAFVHALQTTVVAPLTGIRDTQTRIRNRIREGLKEATEQYESYVFNKVPKLEKTYRSKEQTLEEIRKQEAAVAKQQQLLSETNPALPEKQPHPYMSAAASIRDGHSIRAPSISRSRRSSGSLDSDDPNFPSPNSPTSQSSHPPPSYHSTTPSYHTTAPSMHLAPQQQGYHPSALSPATTIPDRKTPIHFSGVQQSGRSRSGSASGLTLRDVDARSKEIMNDIAAHGKKGFRSLMDRMAGDRDGAPEKSGPEVAVSPPESNIPRRGSVRAHPVSAMKSVKARREAEEADKAYRKGVFHTETLRLRREKLQTSAIQSLTDLNEELNMNLRAALAHYVTHAHATAVTLAQATEVVGNAIKHINLEHDGMQFRSRLPPIVKNKPVVYENYHVGPCQSLIFGVSLTDYDFARGEGGDHGRPPLIVEKCIARIDAFGLETEGIYRISGRVATVRDMVQEIERTEAHFQFKPTYDVHSIAGVLKQYLRELPDPLFPLPLAERVKMTADRDSYLDNKFSVIRSRLRRLPPIHQTTLRAIIEHLARVADHAEENKMDARNLALVFNSVLFGPEKTPENGEALIQMQTHRDSVLEDMITHCDLIFDPATTPLSYHSGEYDYGAYEEQEEESEEEAPKERNTGPGTSRTKLVLVTPRDDLSDDSEPPVDKLTPDQSLSLLFDPALIPQSMQSAIPKEYHLRPLASDDFLRAHFSLLSTLSQSPALAPSTYANLFNGLKASGIYYILVLVERATDELVLSGTLLLERKFSHGGGLSGHIEDIIVSERLQGRGLGQILVRGLREMAANLGAYKVILDCQERMVPFYEKCGFAIRGRQMAHYVESQPPPRKESLAATKALGSPKKAEKAEAEVNDRRLDDIDAETEASDVTYHFPVTA